MLVNQICKAVAITDAKISFVSLVDKAANKKKFLIAKAKDGEAAFTTLGQIVKADAQSHILTGIVYEPMVEDAHGNFMTEDEIIKASYWFAENGDKVDLQHNFEACAACTVVENWVTKSDETIGNTKLEKAYADYREAVDALLTLRNGVSQSGRTLKLLAAREHIDFSPELNFKRKQFGEFWDRNDRFKLNCFDSFTRNGFWQDMSYE